MTVIAYHLVWTAYGWWLPNDPRGSTSHAIRSDVIADLGQLHFGRKRVQPASHIIREFYERAAGKLKHALLTFDSDEREALAACFGQTIRSHAYTCYACAIMPDHVHILIRKHKHRAEDMIQNLQHESRECLRANGRREKDHPVWGGPGWKVFLDTPDDVERTIRYVEQNPINARLPAQSWQFVKKNDGWPLYHKRQQV